MNLAKHCTCSIAIAVSVVFNTTTAVAEMSELDVESDKLTEVIQIFGDQQALETATGSGFILDAEQLEEFEFDDIHRVLQTVPGVYVREEDGFGLRPNIGLRGATAERSSKVAIMEDGVLIAPAPYAAPAAYFFPITSRMTQVEVFKGPSAIAYGPNTVGGAINMVSRPISEGFLAEIDLAFGDFAYGKAHGIVSGEYAGIGFLAEAISLQSTGFKYLANGADTGFHKQEFVGKLRYDIPDDLHNQVWEFKYAYTGEESDETYLGLTDADFGADPYQRYIASENDFLDWEHFSWQLSHYAELSDDISVYTQIYRRDFDRDWDRLNGFAGSRSIATVLRSPETGLNARFYGILNGSIDSLSPDETLQMSLNDRTYFSQGVQSKVSWDGRWSNIDITLDTGLRIHQDQVHRYHRNRFFVMQQGSTVLSGSPDTLAIHNVDEVTAIAGFVNAKWVTDDWHISTGIRVENIAGDANDYLSENRTTNNDTILLPGIGVFYQVAESMGILAGINKGFVPNSPGQAQDINPEQSWNYELGLRLNYSNWQFEFIGFYNDYSNLKAVCTASSGCNGALDEEFNGGEVELWGVELAANGEWTLNNGLKLGATLAFTHSRSEFQTDFVSNFAQWGTVQTGDELPYLPENQANIGVNIGTSTWRVSANVKFVGEMLEAAGTGTELEGLSTEAHTVLDLSSWYQFNNALKIYGKLDNVTDTVEIVSRRPFGARPGKPRQLIAGFKYAF